jgi:hypothetical protein
VKIASRTTKPVEVFFDLPDSVKKMFAESAELRICYQSNGKEQVAQTSLIGGPPETVGQ